jgi:CubicO group peptidase (beta-lactamase class C family)
MVERVGGLSLDRWFQVRLADPLGASPLLFTPTVDKACIAPTEWDVVKNRLLCGEVHDENAAAMGGVAGHAGLFGTAEAVLTISGAWIQALRGAPSLLDRNLARAFTARQRQIPESSWALGWDTPTAPSSSGAYFSPESFGHLGYTGTSLWVDPRRNLEVVLLSNRVHPSRKNEKIRQFRPKIHDLIMQECGLLD